MAGRPMKRLQARTLAKVRKWLLDEERPLSFVLSELQLTVKRWEIIVENDEPLRDILDLLKLKEEEALIAKIKGANQHGVVGAMFALKSRHGYVDQNKPAPPPTAPNVNIQVMIPAPAKSAAEWQSRIIDITPERPALTHEGGDQ